MKLIQEKYYRKRHTPEYNSLICHGLIGGGGIFVENDMSRILVTFKNGSQLTFYNNEAGLMTLFCPKQA